jgi:GTP-binding protein
VSHAGLPVVAIVGRPNVGKSTLFNRIVREHRAIVDDAPGVTRDRVFAPASHGGRAFLCVDTGGFSAEPARDTPALLGRVREQTLTAVSEADCVICVFDGQDGLLPEDRESARLLRRSEKPVFFAVNKIDTPGRDALVHDFQRLGIAELWPVSATHARGLAPLLDAVAAALPPATTDTSGALPGTRLALIGRPNVGKSSLLNRLLGEERVIVAPEAGTTRDAVDTALTVGGKPYVLIDTAGIRRKSRVHAPLERHGAVRALGTLARTDLVLVVLDAAEGMTDQDARLTGRAWEAGRGIILLANKWDTVPHEQRKVPRFREAVHASHPSFAGLPLLCVSARTGEGLDQVFPAIARVERAYSSALATAAINRTLEAAVGAHPPPASGGRAQRLFYATQTGRRPPTVTVFASAPAAIPAAYVRYLAGRFTEAFGLAGVPVRVHFRARPRKPARQAHRPRKKTGRPDRRRRTRASRAR